MVDNVSLLTPELLSAVGRLVVESGHKVAKKKPGEPLRGRCDSFVVESQQAAEKALKAVLMSRGADAWGHTVTALLGLVATEQDAGRELIESAKTLDKHYIPTRYPNGFDTGAPTDFYTRKDSDDAIACAERIVSFARRQIEQPGDR